MCSITHVVVVCAKWILNQILNIWSKFCPQILSPVPSVVAATYNQKTLRKSNNAHVNHLYLLLNRQITLSVALNIKYISSFQFILRYLCFAGAPGSLISLTSILRTHRYLPSHICTQQAKICPVVHSVASGPADLLQTSRSQTLS